MVSINGHVVPKTTIKHPLDQLSADEVGVARQAVLGARKAAIIFRNTFAVEPAKEQMVKFLNAEHAGTLAAETPRPPRQARVQYDVVSDDRSHTYMESIINLASATEVEHKTVPATSQQALTVDEFREFNEVCVKSEMFIKAIKELNLEEKYEVTIDPWPYGGPDEGEVTPRFVDRLS
jgi:primary-amine oxidase